MLSSFLVYKMSPAGITAQIQEVIRFIKTPDIFMYISCFISKISKLDNVSHDITMINIYTVVESRPTL